MRLLLDTHVLLWALVEPDRLSRLTRETLEDSANDVLFSAASIWEIAIKAQLGRIDFPVRPAVIADAAVRTGFVELVVRADAAAKVADLPLHHRDPFDRLLVAQAMSEPARLLTADPLLVPYSELVMLQPSQAS
jgi:PIN domain nuclease of toxin-antitoxin system